MTLPACRSFVHYRTQSIKIILRTRRRKVAPPLILESAYFCIWRAQIGRRESCNDLSPGASVFRKQSARVYDQIRNQTKNSPDETSTGYSALPTWHRTFKCRSKHNALFAFSAEHLRGYVSCRPQRSNKWNPGRGARRQRHKYLLKVKCFDSSLRRALSCL
jgi:hypothetical protein